METEIRKLLKRRAEVRNLMNSLSEMRHKVPSQLEEEDREISRRMRQLTMR